MLKLLIFIKKWINKYVLEIEKILNNTPYGERDFRLNSDLPIRRNEYLGVDFVVPPPNA